MRHAGRDEHPANASPTLFRAHKDAPHVADEIRVSFSESWEGALYKVAACRAHRLTLHFGYEGSEAGLLSCLLKEVLSFGTPIASNVDGVNAHCLPVSAVVLHQQRIVRREFDYCHPHV
jgi:hypothetical protein